MWEKVIWLIVSPIMVYWKFQSVLHYLTEPTPSYGLVLLNGAIVLLFVYLFVASALYFIKSRHTADQE